MGDINEMIEGIWKQFDTDGSGVLEKEEGTKFINKLCEPGSGLEDFK